MERHSPQEPVVLVFLTTVHAACTVRPRLTAHIRFHKNIRIGEGTG